MKFGVDGATKYASIFVWGMAVSAILLSGCASLSESLCIPSCKISTICCQSRSCGLSSHLIVISLKPYSNLLSFSFCL